MGGRGVKLLMWDGSGEKKKKKTKFLRSSYILETICACISQKNMKSKDVVDTMVC